MKVLLLTFLFNLSALLSSKEIKVYTHFSAFENAYLTNFSQDTIYVFNFWATWCKPCVKELPYFDSLLTKQYKQPIKLVLVSLDMENAVENRVKPFIEKRKLKGEVVVLDDGDANAWINKIDSSWSGAIPATLVFKANKKKFYEKDYHSTNELEKDLFGL